MSKQFHTIETVAAFRENILSLWSTDNKRPQSITPDLLIPNGYVELLFVLKGSYKKRKLSAKHIPFTVDKSVIIGIQDKVIMSQNIGELNCIGLQFDPMQFYLLFGDLGVRANNEHLPIVKSGHDKLIKLDEKISKTDSVADAIKKIESFFTNHCPKIMKCEAFQLTNNCLQNLRGKKGNITIENLEKLSNSNVHALNANFKKFIGFSPEEMKNIIKVASTYKKPFINDSDPFLAVSDLFKDINESEENGITKK